MTSNSYEVHVPASEIQIAEAIMVADADVADIIRKLAFSLDVAKRALRHIDQPIAYLKELAELEHGPGCRIDGCVAVQLSSDANWLRDIASKALKAVSN